MTLCIIPLTLKQANAFVETYHRHHKPVVGCKFSIGAVQNNQLVGVAICGRPVARFYDDGLTLEVNRLCTTELGIKNVCSLLYGACSRIAKNMGYKRIITYILQSESGVSLKASGWIDEGSAGGTHWSGKRYQNKDSDLPKEMKRRFARYFK